MLVHSPILENSLLKKKKKKQRDMQEDGKELEGGAGDAAKFPLIARPSARIRPYRVWFQVIGIKCMRGDNPISHPTATE